MKITATILAIFISFLAVKPGVDVVYSMLINFEIGCCDTICSSLTENDFAQNQEQDKDCNSKTCNPFQVCNSCILLMNELASIDYLFKLQFSLKSGFTYQSTITYQYISDFWQPPKLV